MVCATGVPQQKSASCVPLPFSPQPSEMILPNFGSVLSLGSWTWLERDAGDPPTCGWGTGGNKAWAYREANPLTHGPTIARRPDIRE